MTDENDISLRKKSIRSKSYNPMKKKIPKTYQSDALNEEDDTTFPDQLPQFEEEIPLEAVMHAEPISFPEDIPLQAVMHSEPLPIREEIPLQAVMHSEPPKIGINESQSSRIGDIVNEMEKTQSSSKVKIDNAITQNSANILAHAKSIILFTGAGVSAGAVKFRKVPPLTVHVKKAIRDRDYYKILHTIHGKQFRESYLFGSLLPILESKPITGHFAIANLTRIFKLVNTTSAIITQNLEDLHEKADPHDGSIIHIHGSIATGRCSKCNQKYNYLKILKQYKSDPDRHELFLCSTYKNPSCSGVISPDMVEYGEGVLEYDRCATIAADADAIVVIGTSLRVSPANQLVDIVKRNGGKVLLLTRSDTPKDDLADVHIRGELFEVLPAIVKNLKIMLNNDPSIPRKVKKKIKKV